MISNGEKIKIVVAGNATLDAHINGPHEIIGDDIIRISDGYNHETLHVEDPPIAEGRKNRVNQRLDQIVGQLSHRYEPGGGGFNSILALRQLHDSESNLRGAGLDLVYIDVSDPHRYAIRKLRRARIGSNFLYEREIPVNVVLSLGNDRLILKGPSLGRVEPYDEVSWQIEGNVKGSSAILINSVKDPAYVETYMAFARKYNVPEFFTITSSLDWDFVHKQVLPNGTMIFNYDDLAELHGLKSEPWINSRSEKMEHALKTLFQIRDKRLSPDKNAYVTLGANGVYCSGKEGISHVALDHYHAEKVAEHARMSRGSTNGAGDYFSAGVVFFETFFPEMPAVDVAIKSSETAIRHIGYWGPLSKEAFSVMPVTNLRYQQQEQMQSIMMPPASQR